MSTSLKCTLVLAGLLLAAPALASVVTLSGTVRDQTTHNGVAGLTAKLTPPRGGGKPDVVTVTNQSGAFVLRVDSGRYLFEVSQGSTVLYRETIALERDTQKDVQVRR